MLKNEAHERERQVAELHITNQVRLCHHQYEPENWLESVSTICIQIGCILVSVIDAA